MSYLFYIYHVNCNMRRKQKEQRKKATLGHFDREAVVENIGKRIKELRKQQGFKSYELFAYDIEISRTGMSNYESGNFDDIRFKTLLKIIDGLGISIGEFFSDGFE